MTVAEIKEYIDKRQKELGNSDPYEEYAWYDISAELTQIRSMLDKLESKAKWEFIKSKNKPEPFKFSKWWKCSKCETISEHPTKYCCWCGSQMEKECEDLIKEQNNE